MTLLLLAGTSDARRLAVALAERCTLALASLAGATREPVALPLPTRHGGFGGAEGFEAFLEAERIAAVVDATHPFAARITKRTHAVCTARGLPLLRLERPGWTPGRGDRWTFVADEAEAARLIPEDATVFLATGRQSLPAWTGLRACAVHLRVIDPPTEPFPFAGSFVVARPLFDRNADADLFRRLGITHLVVKDSGAPEARTKLDAARDLGIEVVVLRRPARPMGLAVVPTVADALAWVDELPLRSTQPNFGP
jgi:precorrin-6A/cobalt-precorrin-6A reductase